MEHDQAETFDFASPFSLANLGSSSAASTDGVTAATATIEAEGLERLYFLTRSTLPNLLATRYHFDFTQPLAEYNTEWSSCYALTESNKPVDRAYGIIFEPNVPVRVPMMYHFTHSDHGSLMQCVMDYEVVDFPELGRHALCASIPYLPNIPSLKDYLLKNGPIAEPMIINKIIEPISRLLHQMYNVDNLCHGTLNPNTILFDGKQLYIRECISTGCGTRQLTMYEPIDRMLMDPVLKGESTTSTDYFALGMIVLGCLYPRFLETLYQEKNEIMIQSRLQNGTFSMLTDGILLPGLLRDFLRGTLSDFATERWSDRQISDWLRGKKINVQSSPVSEKANRTIHFAGDNHQNTRSLGYAIHRNKELAIRFFREPKIIRWIERNLNKHEIAEKIETENQLYLTRNITGIGDDLYLMRIILLLFPGQNLFFRDYILNISSLGTSLAYGFQKGRKDIVRTVYHLFLANLHLIFIEQTGRLRIGDIQTMLPNNLQSIAEIAEKNDIGFGLERLLYRLNPALPCQSPAIIHYHANTVEQILLSLDAEAKKATAAVLMDRHISAFIHEKISINKEVRIQSLTGLSRFEQDRAIRSLAILVIAEKFVRSRPLMHLTKIFAEKLADYINNFHSKTLRNSLRQKVQALAEEGVLNNILLALTDYKTITSDEKNFAYASHYYDALQQQINMAKNTKHLYDIGYNQGLRFTMFIAFLICSAVLIWISSGYFSSIT